MPLNCGVDGCDGSAYAHRHGLLDAVDVDVPQHVCEEHFGEVRTQRDVEHAPKPHPLCLCCEKRVRPNYDSITYSFREWDEVDDEDMVPEKYQYSGERTGAGGYRFRRDREVTVRRRWQGTFGPSGLGGRFCSGSCAQAWAVALAKRVYHERDPITGAWMAKP